mgnify:CR=1 FL=1
MKDTGTYSIILGLVSIALSIYFVEDQTIKVGLIISVSIIVTYFSFRDYIRQIKKNTQKIEEFNNNLDLHNRLNKIENNIELLKRGEK